MPTGQQQQPQQQTPTLTTVDYKKLILSQCSELLQSPDGKVFTSILISMSERTDRLERENRAIKKHLGTMARVLHALTITDGGDGGDGGDDDGATPDAGETVEGDEGGTTSAATGTAGGAGGGSVKTPSRDERYNQPFPAGVSSTVAGAAAAKPAGGPPVAEAAGPPNKTGPMDDGAGDLTPNVQGTPGVNAQPIPKSPGSNGRRGANV